MSGQLLTKNLQWDGRESYEAAIEKAKMLLIGLEASTASKYGGNRPWRRLVRLKILGGVGFVGFKTRSHAPHVFVCRTRTVE